MEVKTIYIFQVHGSLLSYSLKIQRDVICNDCYQANLHVWYSQEYRATEEVNGMKYSRKRILVNT